MNDPEKKPDLSNVLPFRRASTSKDDGGDTSGNWLRDMKHGTRFLASRKSDNSSKLHDFIVASDPKSMPAVFIGEDINSQQGGFRFVDPKIFVRDYGFFMTLEVIEPPNGDDNQIQPGAVVSNDRVEVRSKVHARKQRVPPGTEPGPVRPSVEDE